MNAIEKHYRLVTIAERIEQLDRDLALISGPMVEGTQQDDLLSASWHLGRAIEKIQAQPSPKQQKETLQLLLQRSIDRAMEKKRCAEIGAAETETAHAENVSRFPKPSTL